MRVLAALILLGASPSVARPQDDASFPVLPVAVLVVDQAGGGPWSFCASETLRVELEKRAYLNVGLQRAPGWVVSPDLILDCRLESNGEKIVLQLRVPGKKRPAARYRFKKARDDLNAIEIAQKLVFARKAIKTAETAFMRRYPPADARAGESALKQGDWQGAASYFFSALRGEEDPAPLYRGLATAYAKLGKPRRAYWYFMAYVKSSGKKIEDVDLTPVLGMEGESEPEIGAAESELLKKWNEARPRDRFRQVIYYSEEIVEESPWAEELHKVIAGVYRSIGWERLAKSWERRRRMAIKVDTDMKLQDKFIRLLEQQ